MDGVPSSPGSAEPPKIASAPFGPMPLFKADSLEGLKGAFGVEKVNAIMARHHINPTTKTLTPDQVEVLHLGLQDVSDDDMNQFLLHLHAGRNLEGNHLAAANQLGRKHLQELRGCIKASKLTPDQFNRLLNALRDNEYTKKLTPAKELPLNKIRSITGKYWHGFVSHHIGRSLEDTERLALNRELEDLRPLSDRPEDRAKYQAAYCELVSKLLVKKHLYYEKAGIKEPGMGMLVPGLKGENGEKRWYRVDEMLDTGLGKFAYRLVPATENYGADMPDLLVYRSSATQPSAMDSFTSAVSDVNIRPPGYLSRHMKKDQEVEWMTHPTNSPVKGQTRPLLITGHSLGSSNAQLALINLQRSERWPNRDIALELFDSPTISGSDAQAFKEQVRIPEGRRLKFEYYVSKGDVVPLVGDMTGSTYLGSHFPDTRQVQSQVHQLELMDAGKTRPGIAVLGPHGTIYYRGTQDAHYRDNRISIADFDKQVAMSRAAVNLAKYVIGVPLVWGIVVPIGTLKRLVWGRRHHDPIIVAAAKKAWKGLKTSYANRKPRPIATHKAESLLIRPSGRSESL